MDKMEISNKFSFLVHVLLCSLSITITIFGTEIDLLSQELTTLIHQICVNYQHYPWSEQVCNVIRKEKTLSQSHVIELIDECLCATAQDTETQKKLLNLKRELIAHTLGSIHIGLNTRAIREDAICSNADIHQYYSNVITQGTQGPQGEQGPAGSTGATGETGAAYVGVMEGTGGVGPTGPQGAQGHTGTAGVTGASITEVIQALQVLLVLLELQAIPELQAIQGQPAIPALQDIREL